MRIPTQILRPDPPSISPTLNREQQRRVGEEIVQFLRTSEGRVLDALSKCISATAVFAPGEVPPARDRKDVATRVELTNETTTEACLRLHRSNVCALVFASAKNPGGGFLKGSQVFTFY